MSDYQGEDRRLSQYCNTQPGMDTKTILALVGISVTVIGGIFASWVTLNNQLTAIKVTQEIKFGLIDQHIISDTQKEAKLNSRMDEIERMQTQLYDRYQQPNRGKL